MIDKELVNILNSFKPLTKDSCKILNEFYSGWFVNRIYPRYYQSSLILTKFVNVPFYFYGVIDDCLCIIHKRFLVNPVLYLVLPPINKYGDLKKEINIIDVLKNHGVRTYLSDEDINLYKMNKNDVKKIKNNCEFIYQSDTFTDVHKMCTKNRYYVNDFKRKESHIKINNINNITDDDVKQLDLLHNSWCLNKNIKNNIKYYEGLNYIPNKCNVLSLQVGNNLFGVSITEEIFDGFVIITSRFTDRDNFFLKGTSLVLHYLEGEYYNNESKKSLMNMGSGGRSLGLIKHKTELQPIKTLQINKNKIHSPVSKETWDVCLPYNKEDI